MEYTTASSSMSEPTESYSLPLTSSDGDDDVVTGTSADHIMGSNGDDVIHDDINDDEDEDQSTVSIAAATAADGGGGGRGMMQFDPAQGIKEPNANDIVCGRGRSSIEHPANLRFRNLINQHKERYQMAKRRDEKTKITGELVDSLRQDGR
jgi:hypothetical protein